MLGITRGVETLLCGRGIVDVGTDLGSVLHEVAVFRHVSGKERSIEICAEMNSTIYKSKRRSSYYEELHNEGISGFRAIDMSLQKPIYSLKSDMHCRFGEVDFPVRLHAGQDRTMYQMEGVCRKITYQDQ